MNIPTKKFHRYIPMTLRTILKWDLKMQIIRWRDIYTDGISIRIISSVNPSVIFNLWPGAQPPLSLSHFYFFLVKFFSTTKQPPLLNLNTTKPSITFSATTTLDLSAFVFWFKFYWGFSTLSKQIYFFLKNLNTILKYLFFCIFL